MPVDGPHAAWCLRSGIALTVTRVGASTGRPARSDRVRLRENGGETDEMPFRRTPEERPDAHPVAGGGPSGRVTVRLRSPEGEPV